MIEGMSYSSQRRSLHSESACFQSCIRLNDGPNIKLVELLKVCGAGLSLVCCLVIRRSTDGFLYLQDFSGVVSQPRDLRVSQYAVSAASSSPNHRPY